jgi:O-antigen/teichoic acid export membrane protein
MPRYFVEGFVGTEALGHWAAVMQITTATALILQPAGQASLARLAVYDQSNPVAFRRLFSSLLGAAGLVGVACAAGAYAIGDTVLALIYRPEYADLQPILVLTMVGAIAAHVSSVLGFTLTAARRFRAQFLLYSVTTVASAVACYLLIPTFGLTGAAYAHIATWVVACLGGGVVFIQHRRVRLGDTDLPEEPSTIKTEASGSVHPS